MPGGPGRSPLPGLELLLLLLLLVSHAFTPMDAFVFVPVFAKKHDAPGPRPPLLRCRPPPSRGVGGAELMMLSLFFTASFRPRGFAH